MSLVPIDFAKLREHDTELYRRVGGFLGIDDDDGIHDVDVNALKQDTRARVLQFLQPKQDEPEVFRINPNEVEARAKLVKAEADEAAGVARLEQYVTEQGLLPVPENAEAVKAFLDEHLRGYWSAAGVDAAVANLRTTLKWKPKTPPPIIAPDTSPTETVRLLSNGEPELQLNASEFQMRRASKAQLLDLDKRQREARGRDRNGWVGAAF